MADQQRDTPRKKIVLDLDLDQLGPLPQTHGAEVRLLPSECTVQLEPGESIFEGAKRVGIAIPSTCGGKGTCGRCRILFPLPARDPTYVERQFIDRADLARGVRLSCRSRPTSPVTVTVLPERPPRA
jgi:ferredoxin